MPFQRISQVNKVETRIMFYVQRIANFLCLKRQLKRLELRNDSVGETRHA